MADQIIVAGSVTIPKAVLRREDDALLHKELTLFSKYDSAQSNPIRAFLEMPDSYQVPRFWFATKLGPKYRHLVVNRDPALTKMKWKFHGQLRPHQLNPKFGLTAVPLLAPLVEKFRGVFTTAPCGSGKTVAAIYTIAQLGLPTLVITPNEAVRRQWITAIKRFLPDVRVTQYDGKKKDTSGDVVVASLQLMSMRPIDRDFPFLIVDEAHQSSCPEFQRAMFNVNYRYSLALTATGDRFDGMDPLFRWALSAHEVELDTDQMKVTCLFRPVYHAQDDRAALETYKSMEVDRFLGLIPRRNEIILNAVLAAHSKGRKLMVLSKNIRQLRALYSVFKHLRPDAKTALYCGEVTRYGKVVKSMERSADEKREDEKYLDDAEAVLFSTYGKAGTGYDNVEKDAIIFAQNVLDVRQALGRVQRSAPGKPAPLALFFVDDLKQTTGRAIGTYWGALAPLGPHRCEVINECPFLLEQLGRKVAHRVSAESKLLWLKSRAAAPWTNS